MSTSKTIPSKIRSASSMNSSSLSYFYITAILSSTSITIDGGSSLSVSAINLTSPIRCKKFTSTNPGEVAYYESN